MRAKYALHPGRVHSQHDSDIHFIGAEVLARLYGVPMSQCVVANEFFESAGLIHLWPRSDGDYSLPTQAARGER